MAIEKVGEGLGGESPRPDEHRNISKDRLSYGYEASVNFEKVSIEAVQLVSSTYVKTDRSEVHLDAERLGISTPEYLVMLALEHERSQEQPSPDINVVMIRFIVHLMKIRGEHSDLIHDFQEVREYLNRARNVTIKIVETELERSVVQNRLKSLFT